MVKRVIFQWGWGQILQVFAPPKLFLCEIINEFPSRVILFNIKIKGYQKPLPLPTFLPHATLLEL